MLPNYFPNHQYIEYALFSKSINTYHHNTGHLYSRTGNFRRRRDHRGHHL